MLADIYLFPKSSPTQKFTLVDSFEEISQNQSQKLFDFDPPIPPSSQPPHPIPCSKFLTLQSDEEITVLFKITEPDLFYNEEKYVLNINWLNLFDTNEKQFFYEFSNGLNTYNNYYKLTVVEKPEKPIILNQNFKIILKVETKNPNKKYIISLSQEALRDNDKSNDKEIEIIDIKEKDIELNKDKIQDYFILICKSDILGRVYLPRLKFLLYEDNNNNPTGNVFDALISFNCIQQNDNS